MSRSFLRKDYLRIDEELELFSDVRDKELYSLANQVLLMEVNDEFVEDTFAHEQNLIITEGNRLILIAGCAHHGIVNIVKRFAQIKGRNPDYIIGGFHLYNPSTHQSEAPELIDAIGEYLKETGSMYYTCHCTGFDAFERLKSLMGDNIQYLATGNVVIL